MNSTIHIIVALGETNRVIGKKGGLTWHISEDFKHFKNMTMGHPIIMGRKTFESIGKALPVRTNIVISRSNDIFPDCESVHSIEEAFEIARKSPGSEDIYVIGGGMIYELALPFADVLDLTVVRGDFDGDVFFPEYKHIFTEIISSETHDNGEYKFNFVTLKKPL